MRVQARNLVDVLTSWMSMGAAGAHGTVDAEAQAEEVMAKTPKGKDVVKLMKKRTGNDRGGGL